MRCWRRLRGPLTSQSFWPCLERNSKVRSVSDASGREQRQMFTFRLNEKRCLGASSQSCWSAGADPEETILNAFKVFDPEGKGTLRKDLWVAPSAGETRRRLVFARLFTLVLSLQCDRHVNDPGRQVLPRRGQTSAWHSLTVLFSFFFLVESS